MAGERERRYLSVPLLLDPDAVAVLGMVAFPGLSLAGIGPWPSRRRRRDHYNALWKLN